MTRAVELAQVASTGVSEAFKNRIINGAMVIDQRNAGASVTPSTNGTYTLDRWVTFFTQSSKFSVQQNAGSVTPPAGFTNYIGITSTAATTVGASDEFEVVQSIEGFNAADFDFGKSTAKTLTLSFWVRSSLTGTFGGSIYNSAVDWCYPYSYTISSANTWEYKTITIPGQTSGTWLTNNGRGMAVLFSLGAGSNRLATANAWINANRVGPTGQVNLVATNGATLYITGVQLEVGSSATSFEYLDYGNILRQCQRYFQICAFSGVAFGTGEMGIASQNKVTMRAQASMSTALFNSDNCTNSANQIIRVGIGNTVVGSASYNAASTGNNIGNILCTGLTTGGIYFGSFQASAEL
jgi:hypothetical protein